MRTWENPVSAGGPRAVSAISLLSRSSVVLCSLTPCGTQKESKSYLGMGAAAVTACENVLVVNTGASPHFSEQLKVHIL